MATVLVVDDEDDIGHRVRLSLELDGHRLNVATSRARAMAIIVASPDLIRVSCRTPHQMTLANALCRAWEQGQRPGVATAVGSASSGLSARPWA